MENKKDEIQQGKKEKILPLGNSLGARHNNRGRILQRDMPIGTDNHLADIYVGRFVKKYIKFKNECVEREVLDINEIIKLYEVWLHNLG